MYDSSTVPTISRHLAPISIKKNQNLKCAIFDSLRTTFKVSVKENEVPTEKLLVARVFSLQRQVIYQIKAKRLNYLIKDFILSNFKRRLMVFALELRGIDRVYC